jgi:hypothetical protein
MRYFPQEWWTELIVDAYYRHLNGYRRFQDELRDIFLALAEPMAELERLDGAGKPDLQGLEWPYHPTGDEHDPYYRAFDQAAVMLSNFCERWHLPRRRGIGDLAHSFKQWKLLQDHGHDDPPELMTGGRCAIFPHVGLPVHAGSIPFEDITIPVIEHIPIIMPNAPLPFIFDPAEQSREELNRRIEAICREIRESILNQVEAYERQAKEGGLCPRPSRMTPAQVERIGRAIYRRAVCRWKWDRIRHEYMADGDPVYDAQRFADRIRDWARECDIPL